MSMFLFSASKHKVCNLGELVTTTDLEGFFVGLYYQSSLLPDFSMELILVRVPSNQLCVIKTTRATQSRISQGCPRYLGLVSKFQTQPVGHHTASLGPVQRYIGGKEEAFPSSTGNTALPLIASVLWTTNDHTKPCRVFHLLPEPMSDKWSKPFLGLGEEGPARS